MFPLKGTLPISGLDIEFPTLLLGWFEDGFSDGRFSEIEGRYPGLSLNSGIVGN